MRVLETIDGREAELEAARRMLEKKS